MGGTDKYIEKWTKVLDKFEDFKNKCNLDVPNVDLSMVDEKTISGLKNDFQLFNNVVSRLHEDHDCNFPEPFGKRSITVLENEKAKKYPKMINEDVHIIDVDYEYEFSTGLNIILYTRIIGSDDTIFVRYRYQDYFYIEITPEVNVKTIEKVVKSYCWFLQNQKYKDVPLRDDNRRHPSNINTANPLIISMEVVDDLKTMYGYQPEKQTFMKITTVNPTVTQDLFNGLSKKYIGGEVEVFKYVDGVKHSNGFEYFPEMKFFEAKTSITNKFLTEFKLAGSSACKIVGTKLSENRYSNCTIAVDATSIVLLEDAPFYTPRTFFYDIECVSLNINEFPTSDVCPVIQISYVCADGQKEVSKGVLCLKDTPGYESFEDEGEMLIMFAKKIVDFNPDYITGYNSNCFDMPYIIDRMKVTGVYDVASMFSRRKQFKVSYKRDFKQSKQFGTKEVVKYVTPGRAMFDQMEIIKGNAMIRLRSYSLKSVCAEFLGDDNKEDLAYRDIPDLFKTPEGRAKIASYCLQDSVLLKKLDDKMMLGLDIAAQASVQGITANLVLNRGLVHRLMCKLKQYTSKYNFIIPTFTKKQFPESPTYQGATVLNCDAGYYNDPVVVLDFASLYPSLIRSYNLDYTTIAQNKQQVENYPDRFQKFENGYSFVKNEYHRGLLPRIEAELAVERTNAKKKMKNAKDDIEKAVWNAMQGGIKIVMNSIYGMCGSPTAPVPCVPIASSITFLGRMNLQRSKDYVEANYQRLTGEKENCKVIYGDTVS